MTYADQFVLFGSTPLPLYLVDLQVAAVGADGAIDIRVSSEEIEAVYRRLISDEKPAGYSHSKVFGPDVFFKKSSGVVVSLEEHLAIDPLIVRYADGTYSYNCYHIPTNLNAGSFPASRLEVWSWKGIPLNRESMGKNRLKDTIQYRAFHNLQAEFDLIFNDDGSGEAADLVALKDVDETTIRLCLVHCKNAHEGKVTQDIRNFYVLCGQLRHKASCVPSRAPRRFTSCSLTLRFVLFVRHSYAAAIPAL